MSFWKRKKDKKKIKRDQSPDTYIISNKKGKFRAPSFDFNRLHSTLESSIITHLILKQL